MNFSLRCWRQVLLYLPIVHAITQPMEPLSITPCGLPYGFARTLAGSSVIIKALQPLATDGCASDGNCGSRDWALDAPFTMTALGVTASSRKS